MIKSTELRIGNLVTVNRGEYTGGEGIAKILNVGRNLPSAFYPIALTAEILEKCGFYDRGGLSALYISKGFTFGWSEGNGFFFQEGDDAGTYLSHIKYMHQLQNLYFALIGEELEVKL